ncbi:hypothetical protein Leryth_021124 [Lithospermum erythrorhizon]|nr:hypothetical protein Leryth_021124 [Lithospermum erythrorhizon]
MGLCISRRETTTLKRRHSTGGVGASYRWNRTRSKKHESLINEQALAAAIILQQQLRNGGGGSVAAFPFDRSSSVRYQRSNSKGNEGMLRSKSTRARSLTDPLLQPHQLVNQV